METIKFQFDGRDAIVVRPDNPNGKWIWKTEFFDGFDKSEQALLGMGYTRVYYRVSDMYGSYHAVRLMHNFYLELMKRFDLNQKGALLGFSRGGLYAFNFALAYPEYVDKVYLDAPVLDLRTWPLPPRVEYFQMLDEYPLDAETLKTFKGHPVCNFEEYFKLGIPTMIVAGDADEAVPFEKNSALMIEYAENHGVDITYIIKPGCGHHPHGLEDNTPIIDFVEKYGI